MRPENPISADAPRLLTIRETCQVLRIHENTIYRWIQRGLLPATKIGRDWRIDSRVLNQILEAGQK
jgi:excisionase family DNA binding protein